MYNIVEIDDLYKELLTGNIYCVTGFVEDEAVVIFNETNKQAGSIKIAILQDDRYYKKL